MGEYGAATVPGLIEAPSQDNPRQLQKVFGNCCKHSQKPNLDPVDG